MKFHMLMFMNAWMMLVLMKCKCQMKCLTLGYYIASHQTPIAGAPGRGFTEHLMASLTKPLGLHLFLLGTTRRNKKASEFNHDTLRGLMDQGPKGSPWGYYLDGL